MPVPPSPDPALNLLTGPDVDGLLASALEPAGARLLSWSLRDVDHRPGNRTTASYLARVAWPDVERDETLGASVRASGRGSADRPPDGSDGTGLRVTDGDHDVQIWRFPFDPELPALPAVCFPHTAGELLRGMGLALPDPALEVISYRPRKRAVVRAEAAGRRLYLKVLRPRQAAEMFHRHDLLGRAGLPVPTCLGWSEQGLIVLDELSGRPLRAAIDETGSAACSAEELVALLDSMPASAAELPRRTPWAAHAAHYAGVVAAAVPGVADRARSLAADIGRAVDGDDGGTEVTHGDFYEAQLTVEQGRVAGVLDIDTVGPGRRADDLACMVAHLSVIASDRTPGPADAARSWLPVFDRRVDPVELRVRAAAVVMSLAPGPFRTQEDEWESAVVRRIDLVERWLDCTDAGTSPF